MMIWRARNAHEVISKQLKMKYFTRNDITVMLSEAKHLLHHNFSGTSQ